MSYRDANKENVPWGFSDVKLTDIEDLDGSL